MGIESAYAGIMAAGTAQAAKSGAGGTGLRTLPQAMAGRAAAILPALQAAANRVGTDFTTLFHTARLESGFNPDAKAGTSSATGLFQFIDSTWLSTLARHGPSHGINPASRAEALALRRDPAVASLMAAEHMADNAKTLSDRLGRAADGAELYLAHFLGVGGAARFLSAMATNPAMTAAELLPAAARSNRAVFVNGSTGQPRSLEEVFSLLRDRFFGTASPVAPAAPAVMAEPADAQTRHLDQRASLAARNPAASAPSGVEARRAAQAAYLLLAELGAS